MIQISVKNPKNFRRVAMLCLCVWATWFFCGTEVDAHRVRVSAEKELLSAPNGDAMIRLSKVSVAMKSTEGKTSVTLACAAEQRAIKTLATAPSISIVLKDETGSEITHKTKSISDNEWRTAPGKGRVYFELKNDEFQSAQQMVVQCDGQSNAPGSVFNCDLNDCGLKELVLNIPVLECTVEHADGFFNAYSVHPKPGDTLTLDVKKLLADKRSRMLKFGKGGLYISTAGPFKLAFAKDEGKLQSCKLIGSEGTGLMKSTSRIDIHPPNAAGTRPWKVYYVAERDGLVQAVIVFTAKAK